MTVSAFDALGAVQDPEAAGVERAAPGARA